MFEKGAQVEEWPVEDSFVDEEKGDQEASDTPVAVQEGMNRLELDMSYPTVDERRQVPALMQKSFEVVQGMVHVSYGRRNEGRSLQ